VKKIVDEAGTSGVIGEASRATVSRKHNENRRIVLQRMIILETFLWKFVGIFLLLAASQCDVHPFPDGHNGKMVEGEVVLPSMTTHDLVLHDLSNLDFTYIARLIILFQQAGENNTRTLLENTTTSILESISCRGVVSTHIISIRISLSRENNKHDSRHSLLHGHSVQKNHSILFGCAKIQPQLLVLPRIFLIMQCTGALP